MSPLDLILSLVTSLLGCSTVVGFILYRKAHRRMKYAEAQKLEAEALKMEAEARRGEIDNENAMRDMYEEALRDMREEHAERTKELRATIAEVNLMYHAAIKDGARKDGIIEDKTVKIRQLNETINDLYRQLNRKDRYIAALRRFIEWLRIWHCEREQSRPDMDADSLSECCDRRKPPHKVPVKYEPCIEPPKLDDHDS